MPRGGLRKAGSGSPARLRSQLHRAEAEMRVLGSRLYIYIYIYIYIYRLRSMTRPVAQTVGVADRGSRSAFFMHATLALPTSFSTLLSRIRFIIQTIIAHDSNRGIEHAQLQTGPAWRTIEHYVHEVFVHALCVMCLSVMLWYAVLCCIVI